MMLAHLGTLVVGMVLAQECGCQTRVQVNAAAVYEQLQARRNQAACGDDVPEMQTAAEGCPSPAQADLEA
jgi:hypothetical protein